MVVGNQVLIVEDDPAIRRHLSDALRMVGYEVLVAEDGAAARERAAAATELVLLDLGLPDVDGVELCRWLRRTLPRATIVVLTARDAEIDVIVGLDAGADDYLTKPFRLAELTARVRAHMRRRGGTGATVHQVGDLVVHVAARRVTVAGAEVELRPREFDLLARLAADTGAAVTRETLMSDVWDEHWFGSTKTLDMHISSLRRKLGRAGGRITTLRGVGYRLEST